MSRFKFAVPIVADMLNKRYRRRQFDSADSEFCDLEKTEYKGNPLLSGGGFFCGNVPLQIPTFLKVGALLRLAKRSGINDAMITG